MRTPRLVRALALTLSLTFLLINPVFALDDNSSCELELKINHGVGGTAYDNSGKGRDGTISGADWSTSTGDGSPYSLSWNDSTDKITVNHATAFDYDKDVADAISVCGWFTASGIGANDILFGSDVSAYHLGYTGGTTVKTYNNAAGPASIDVTDGEWHFACAFYTGTGHALGIGEWVVIDGINGSRVNASIDIGVSAVVIGNRGDSTKGWDSGFIDNYLFFNRTITPTEYNNLYTTGTLNGGGGGGGGFTSSINITTPAQNPTPGIQNINISVDVFVNSSGPTTLQYYFDSVFHGNETVTANGTHSEHFLNVSEGSQTLEVKMYDNQGPTSDSITLNINRTWPRINSPINESSWIGNNTIQFNYSCNYVNSTIHRAYININGTIFQNTTPVTVPELETIALPTGNYTWNVTCEYGPSSPGTWGLENETSQTWEFNITTYTINITCYDADNGSLCTGGVPVRITNITTGVVIDSGTIQGGSVLLYSPEGRYSIIAGGGGHAYYPYPRTYFLSFDSNTNISVYLRLTGTGQYFTYYWVDGSYGSLLDNVLVNISFNGNIVAQFQTDASGAISDYQQAGQPYLFRATKSNYEDFSQSLAPATGSYTMKMYRSTLPLINAPDISLTTYPAQTWFAPWDSPCFAMNIQSESGSLNDYGIVYGLTPEIIKDFSNTQGYPYRSPINTGSQSNGSLVQCTQSFNLSGVPEDVFYVGYYYTTDYNSAPVWKIVSYRLSEAGTPEETEDVFLEIRLALASLGIGAFGVALIGFLGGLNILAFFRSEMGFIAFPGSAFLFMFSIILALKGYFGWVVPFLQAFIFAIFFLGKMRREGF